MRRGARHRRVFTCASLALAVACSRGESTPVKHEEGRSPWVQFRAGLPADSFPLPSRRFSSIVAPRWTSELARDAAHEAQTVMDAMGIKAGMSVADVGAGDGYYVLRLSQRVGPKGRVFGEDIVPEYLRELSSRVTDAKATNVVVVRGVPHDPRLPNDSLDAAIMIHMYHEVSAPFALLWNLAHALKPGARVGILDTTFPTDEHGTPPWLLECELGTVGFTKERSIPLQNDEYLEIFRAPARDAIPSPLAIRSSVRDGKCVQR